MRKNEKGAAAMTICIMTIVIMVSSYYITLFGINSKNSMKEWQAVDSCAYSIGKDINLSNDIEKYCNDLESQGCIFEDISVESEFSCYETSLVCNEEEVCTRSLIVTGSIDNEGNIVERSSAIELVEENHEVKKIDAAVVFLLDFSGSMRNNRINQLKNAFRQFVESEYNLSYAVLLYNSDIIEYSNIDKGLNHDTNSLMIVNRNSPSGGTNFVSPLRRAIELINSTNKEAYYIILVSDGSPNEGPEQSVRIVNNVIKSRSPESCMFPSYQEPCISIYTLGVDNANTDVLGSLSGNSNNSNANEFSFSISSNQTNEAFKAIIEEIICRIGPIYIDSEFNIFNETTLLDENTDYFLDLNNNIIKFYDEEPHNICTRMLENNAKITLRKNNAKIKAIE